MEFNKYKERGAYHWDLYGKDPIYTGHVDKVLKWVLKSRTLDVGAGDGLITYMLDVVGVDNNELAVSLAQERGANVTLGSAYDLPDAKYHNVLMLDVLEHFEKPEIALEQVKKVLLPGGLLYIVTPPKGDKLHDYHYQEWTFLGLMNLLSTNGFECVSLEIVNEYVRMYGIFKMI